VTLADGSTQTVSMDWTPTLSAQNQVALALAGLGHGDGVATGNADAVDRDANCVYTYGPGGDTGGCLIVCCGNPGMVITCSFYGSCTPHE
jgi:hypothetical protein